MGSRGQQKAPLVTQELHSIYTVDRAPFVPTHGHRNKAALTHSSGYDRIVAGPPLRPFWWGETALVEVAPPLFGGGMRLYFYAASLAGIHRTESEQREHQQNTYSPAECGEWGGPISSVWIATRIACPVSARQKNGRDTGGRTRDGAGDSTAAEYHTATPHKRGSASLQKARGRLYFTHSPPRRVVWLLYLALVGVDTRAFSYATAATVKRCTVWGLQKSLYMNSYAARKALVSKRLVVTALLRAM